jgi:hypothetical protein
MLALSPAMAQSLLEPAPGRFVNGERPQDGSIYMRENIIWSEDFADGIPSDWLNTGDPELAIWEYRGPSTNPSNLVGSRGSCTPEETYGPPIQSPTADNGFMIFDSNYWDDNIGPCGSFGTGIAPGPHFATLELPSIDLTAYPYLGISFYQYCKNYQAEQRLEYSIEGGDWMIAWENDVPLNSGESPEDRFDRIDISALVGGNADVRFRFVFDGNYYHWMIDDIQIFELLENDLHIESATYGNFNPNNQGNETGYEFLEYSLYPSAMAPRVFFQAATWNYGYAQQTGCNLDAVLRNDATMDTIYEANMGSTTLDPGEFYEFNQTPYQHDGTIAPYSVHLRVEQNQEEDAEDDNFVMKEFGVNDFVYARDRLETEGIYVPNQDYAGSPYEVGNYFVITADDQAVESVSIGIGAGTSPDATVYARIYSLYSFGPIVAAEVASTEEFLVTAESYNNVGDNHVMTIPFPEPVALDRDSAYLVVAGTPNGPENVFFPVSGDSPDLTSFVRFYPNSWFFLVRTPMVRMNFGPVTNVEEPKTSTESFSVYPNPANDLMTMELHLLSDESVDVVVYNEIGQIIDTHNQGLLSRGEHRMTLNTSSYPNGWYVVSVRTTQEVINEMIIVRH